MIPDPRSGRVLRGIACVMFAVGIVVVACERKPEAGEVTGQRIVSIGGAVTETVFALGAGDRVVAVDTSSVYPASTEKLPKVGYQRALSAEGILAFAPDLVLVSDEAGPASTIEQLRAAGVRVEKLSGAQTIDSAVARITAVGAAIDRPAATLATKVRDEATAARARVPATRPKFVLIYARGAGTLMVSGTGTQGAAMLELAGGKNAVTGFDGWKTLSAESLIAAAPDVLVMPARGLGSLGGEAGLLALPGVADTPAGRARRFVPFDDLLLLGFGPRLGPAIADLAAALRTER